MQAKNFYMPLKILSVIVLLSMAAAVAYAFTISVVYWTGIGV